jgi:transducin (beta)-like 1
MKTDGPEPIKRIRSVQLLLVIKSSRTYGCISGHTDEINQLRCNPSRTRLASCSDDNTTRVWNVDKIEPDSDETIPGLAATDQMIVPVVLAGHTHSVTMIGWMPGRKPGAHEIVATSSFDSTVRIWDAVTGKCLELLSDHQRPVYALTFSPDGKWLATGSGDGWLYIYSVKVGYHLIVLKVDLT